nr:MAG TPA: hypothetical protein [Caudoviricetes sp.]
MAYIEMVHSSKRYQMGSTAIVANDDVHHRSQRWPWNPSDNAWNYAPSRYTPLTYRLHQ